jgi:hypothetical protein
MSDSAWAGKITALPITGARGGVTSEPDQHNYGPYDAALCFHWVTYLPSAMKFSADPNSARNGPGSSGAERQPAAMAGVIPETILPTAHRPDPAPAR